MSSAEANEKPVHIRPKPRRRQTQKKPKHDILGNKETNVEDLIEQTRQKMASVIINSSARSASSLNMGAISSSLSGVHLSKSGSDEPRKIEIVSMDGKKPKGILKSASQYSSKASSVQEGIATFGKIRDLDNDTLADELGLPKELDSMMGGYFPSEETPTVKAFVKDRVVERPVQIPRVLSSNIEVEVMKNNDTTKSVKKDDAEPPMKVIKTLSELLATETTALNASAEKESAELNDGTIEANMEFSCMSTEEYDEIVKEAASSGLTLDEYLESKKEENERNSENENVDGSDPYNSNENHLDVDCDEVNDMFDFFGVGMDAEEEIMPSPPLRPFIILWNALSCWITAEAVEVLKKHKKESFIKSQAPIIQTPSTPKEIEQPSDICLSRCAGLMNMLKMNLVKSLDDLGYSADDGYTRRVAETRLSEFVQCFDYSESMVKFQTDMWKAITVILLYIVLPRRDIAFEGRSGVIMEDETEVTLPSSLQGMLTIVEYKYLIDSAIPSLAIGSGN